VFGRLPARQFCIVAVAIVAAIGTADSFFRSAREGRFARLEDRDDLRALLLTIAYKKACDAADRDNALKRGGGKVVAASRVGGESDDVLDRADPLPGPAESAAVTDEPRRLLAMLESEELTRVAVMKMASYTNQEIAAAIDRSVSRAQGNLALIRAIWANEVPEEWRVAPRKGGRPRASD